MLSKAETRFLTDVEALRELIAAGKLKKPDLIQRRIGRLQKKHPRAARFYTLHHSAAQGFTAQRDDEKHSQASEVLGNYILKTDHTLDAAQTWSLYMTLLQAEEGFCALKSTLGIRPNYHQLEGRVDGHIFISVLAFHLTSTSASTGKQPSQRNRPREKAINTVVPLGALPRFHKPFSPYARSLG
jgi:transposase